MNIVFVFVMNIWLMIRFLFNEYCIESFLGPIQRLNDHVVSQKFEDNLEFKFRYIFNLILRKHLI